MSVARDMKGGALCWLALSISAACGGSPASSGSETTAPANGIQPGSSASGAGTSGSASSTPGTTVPRGAAGASTGPAAGSGARAGAAGAAGTAGSAGATPAAVGDEDAGTRTPDNDAGTKPDAASGSPRSTGPGDWTAGDYPAGLMDQNYLELTGLPNQAGVARQYKVHVPPSYDPSVPMPAVFCFHGLGQDAVMFCVLGADMPKKSDEAGFILVMPNGYQNSWNGGTCCGEASTQKLDEVGFVRAVFEEVGKHVNIDLSRVYATGLSNGGYMSFRMACEASDLFVAVAPGAGAIGSADIGGGTNTESDLVDCAASGVSVLAIHGNEDGLVSYDLHKPSLDRIAEKNGCQLTTRPAEQPASAGDTSCLSYEGCPAGVDVTGCTITGGGHVWFGSPNCGTGVDAACAIVGANSENIVNTDVIWEFFSKHTR